jgi:hypothetical protein
MIASFHSPDLLKHQLICSKPTKQRKRHIFGAVASFKGNDTLQFYLVIMKRLPSYIHLFCENKNPLKKSNVPGNAGEVSLEVFLEDDVESLEQERLGAVQVSPRSELSPTKESARVVLVDGTTKQNVKLL